MKNKSRGKKSEKKAVSLSNRYAAVQSQQLPMPSPLCAERERKKKKASSYRKKKRSETMLVKVYP
jgi:hypothetical protein